MASSFIGLPVLISLRSGLSITGTVQSVNAVQGTIVLSSAHLHQPGEQQQGGEGEYLGTRALSRTEVVGLEVISVRKEGDQQLRTERAGERRQQRNASSGVQQEQTQHQLAQQQQQHCQQHYAPQVSDSEAAYSDLSHAESPAPGSARKSKASSKRGGRKTSSKQQQQGGWETGNDADADWSAIDERGDSRNSARRHPPQGAPSFPPAQHPSTQAQYASSPSHHRRHQQQQQQQGSQSFDLNEEFDFGAGLRSFDKKKVFEEIRSQDATDPSQLLVSHNRLSSASSGRGHDARMVKLLPNESVLSAHELEEQKDDGAAALEGLSLGAGREPSTGEEESEDYSTAAESGSVGGVQGLAERRGTLRPSQDGKLREPGWYTTEGVKVVTVRQREWREVLSVADIESSPSPLHRQLTTSHSLASYILSLPSHASTSPQQPPTICLLAPGTSSKGTLALRAATHLCNRGWRVIVWTGRTAPAPEADGAEERREALRGFSTASGRVIRDLADLEPETYAVVVDAMADSDAVVPSSGTQAGPSVEDMAAARWVNESGVRVLSIDSAWGRGVDTGAALLPSPITPTYLCSLGALRLGATLLESSATPELAILDVGLSPALWSRCGVEGVQKTTFGNGWWVAVEKS